MKRPSSLVNHLSGLTPPASLVTTVAPFTPPQKHACRLPRSASAGRVCAGVRDVAWGQSHLPTRPPEADEKPCNIVTQDIGTRMTHIHSVVSLTHAPRCPPRHHAPTTG